MSDAPVAVAGLGLIGGSIALRARAVGRRVIGFDRDAAVVAQALARGAIDAGVPDLGSLVAEGVTLAIALPLDATLDALAQLSGRRGPALVIDVASVKREVAAFAGRVPAFVATHPMAGRERGGIAAADPELFCGATWAYVPGTDAPLAARTEAFIAMMGARPYAIDAVAHDVLAALGSHLPQAVAVALATAAAEAGVDREQLLALCGTGMGSMVRLGRSPASVWSPIFAANANAIAAPLRRVAELLADAASGLERGDIEPLIGYFGRGESFSAAVEERLTSGTRW